MARRRFYAPPAAFAPDERAATLSADETRHLRDVLRLQSGDEIYVFDGAGREFQCAIGAIGKDSTQIKVIAEDEPARPESPLHLTLAIALLKGEKFDLVIQKATELGVKRIVPLVTERADVRLRDGQDTNRRVTRWQRIALEAAKQTGRATVPEVATPLIFSSLPTMTDSRSATRLMFSEREGRSLFAGATLPEGQPSEIVALVGPEGGWTNEEIDLARRHGWEIVTLGGRILRAETAAIVILSLLQHRFGDLV